MINDVTRLAARIVLGASIAAHGAQKEWGWFGGPGPAAAGQFLESLGFQPGAGYARAAARTEIVAGALLALGLGGPAGPAAVVSTMIVAQSSAHAKNGFFAQQGGIELGTIYAAAALALASSGYGRLSLDEAFGWHKLRESGFTGLALAGGVAAALVVLAQRTTPPAAAAAIEESAKSAAAAGQTYIAAAIEERPVPADLIVTSEDAARG